VEPASYDRQTESILSHIAYIPSVLGVINPWRGRFCGVLFAGLAVSRFVFLAVHCFRCAEHQFQNFKLEEEESTALLLLLPIPFADDCIFGSASGLGCWLVVGAAQVTAKLTLQAFCCSATYPLPLYEAGSEGRCIYKCFIH
jgi:hypothetical protein